MLGSFSGTAPGIAGFSLVLPLNLDVYLLHTLEHPNTPPLASSLGVLDGSGDGQAFFALAAGAAPGVAGTTLHHAYAVLDLAAGTAVLTSNPVPITLLP